MPAKAIKTDKAPEPVGPYSQALVVGKLVFTAGQVGISPATKQMIAGGIGDQTRQVLNNIGAILEAAGSSMPQVVKTTVFLANIADFKAMNEVYQQFFPGIAPARSTVQVTLPGGALVEIEAIASLD